MRERNVHDMTAFWPYDQYPFCLHGDVFTINDDGSVFIEAYLSSFRPLVIMPTTKATVIAEELKKLRLEYESELRELKRKYKRLAEDVAPFLKK